MIDISERVERTRSGPGYLGALLACTDLGRKYEIRKVVNLFEIANIARYAYRFGWRSVYTCYMARPVMTGTGMALCYQARGRSGKVVARGWRGQGVGAPLGGGGVEWWRPTCWWLGWARGRPPAHHRPATSGRWSQQTGGWCPASVAVAGEA